MLAWAMPWEPNMKRGALLAILAVSILLIPVVRNQGEQYNMYLPTVNASPQPTYVGDSLTAGYVPLLGGGQVFKWYEVTNSYTFFDQVPDGGTLVIELGIHEAKGKNFLFTIDEGAFALAYTKLVDRAAETHNVVLVDIPWLRWDDTCYARAMRFNEIIRNTARERGLCYASIWGIMESCGRDCISDDGFHPNELGYSFIAESIARCLNK